MHTSYDDICILSLTEEEFGNPNFKNLSISKANNFSQIIYVKNTDLVPASQTFEGDLERLAVAMQTGAQVAIIYECEKWSGKSERKLAYEEAFSLQADRITGIGFCRDLIRTCGSFHVGFPGADVLELLCRLLCQVKTCQLILPKEPEKHVDENSKTKCESNSEENNGMSEEQQEEIAFSHAYLIRRHMEHLRKEQLLNEALQGTSELMLRQACFPLFQQYMNYFLENQGQYEKLAAFTAPFLILRGDDTCGGVLQQFADDLTAALISNGQIVCEITGEEEDDKGLASFYGKILKGIVGFQAPVLESKFCRELPAPKFQFWFDNPFSFQNILCELPKDHYVLCQDGDHAEWIKKYYHTMNAIQFPPGGMDKIFLDGNKAGIQERNKDIVFMGRYFSDDTRELTQLQKKFYEFMLAHPTLNFEQGIQSFYGKRKIDVPKELFSMKAACRAVIGHFRNEVVKTILQAGFTVHVYGKEWKEYEGEGKGNLIIHPEVSMLDSVKEFQSAKIGLNVMSWYKAGMTERIANLMLSGAVCLSDETKYLKEHMTDREDILLYRLDKLEELPGIIQSILEDDEKRQSISEKAYEKAKKEFGWNTRSRELIKLAEQHHAIY